MNSNRMRVYVNNSFHLRRKYVRVFVQGHHLFRDANSLFNVKEKCTSIFSRQMKPNVTIIHQTFSQHTGKKCLRIAYCLLRVECLLLRVLSFDFVNENACPFLCDNSYTLSS